MHYQCIFHESSVFACFEVADTERPVRGKEARWERETGWEIQRRDVLWTPQTILSTDSDAESHSGSPPLR